MARGTVSEEQKTVPAVSVIVMTKTDLEQKQREQAEWQKRGTTGVVKAISPDATELTIAARTRDGVTSMTTVAVSPKTTFRRYAPGSVRFADAKPSAIAEIKPGDQVRVLGDKNEEHPVTAEEIVDGTFRTIAGTVVSVDAATGELEGHRPRHQEAHRREGNAELQVKKQPEMMARRLAMQPNGGEHGRRHGRRGGVSGCGRAGGEPRAARRGASVHRVERPQGAAGRVQVDPALADPAADPVPVETAAVADVAATWLPHWNACRPSTSPNSSPATH